MKKLIGFEMLVVLFMVGAYLAAVNAFNMKALDVVIVFAFAGTIAAVVFAAAAFTAATATAFTAATAAAFAAAATAVIAAAAFAAAATAVIAAATAAAFAAAAAAAIAAATIAAVVALNVVIVVKESELRFWSVFGSLMIEAAVIAAAMFWTPWAAIGALVLLSFLWAPAQKPTPQSTAAT